MNFFNKNTTEEEIPTTEEEIPSTEDTPPREIPRAKKTKVIILDNFALKDLDYTFNVASFQRKIDTPTVNAMVNSLLKGKFSANTLVATSPINNVYTIFDGQHRLAAFKILRDKYGVTEYDLKLLVYLEGTPRDIYRELNLGRSLTLGDHLKALDTGKSKFFNELSEYCHHGKGDKIISYAEAVNMLYYANTRNSKVLKVNQVEYYLPKISDISYISFKLFLTTLNQIKKETNFDELEKIDLKRNMRHSPVTRNLYRIMSENNLDEEKIKILIFAIMKSQEIHDFIDLATNIAMIKIYEYMTTELSNELGLTIEKYKTE